MYEKLTTEELVNLIQVTEQELKAFNSLLKRKKVNSEVWVSMIDIRLKDLFELKKEIQKRK